MAEMRGRPEFRPARKIDGNNAANVGYGEVWPADILVVWLSNRVFKSYEAILDHCCHTWNKLIEQPSRIMSLGIRDWAHRL
jgi:hypothetical protein